MWKDRTPEEVIRLQELGYHCHLMFPSGTGWNQISKDGDWDEEEIEAHQESKGTFAILIMPGDNVLILDFDAKHDDDGKTAFKIAKGLAEHGEPVVEIKTRSEAGRHYYFAKPPWWSFDRKRKIGRTLEFFTGPRSGVFFYGNVDNWPPASLLDEPPEMLRAMHTELCSSTGPTNVRPGAGAPPSGELARLLHGGHAIPKGMRYDALVYASKDIQRDAVQGSLSDKNPEDEAVARYQAGLEEFAERRLLSDDGTVGHDADDSISSLVRQKRREIKEQVNKQLAFSGWRQDESEKVEPDSSTSIEWPSDLYDLGGIPGEFIGLCDKYANRPQLTLALGASLALSASIIAGRVQVGTLRPNIYILGSAPSGSGKDFPRQLIKDVLKCVEATSGRSQNGVASYQGLIRMVSEEPNSILLLDEVQEHLHRLGDKRADANISGISRVLKELFSSSEYQSEVRANEPTRKVEKSCLSLYGTGTEDMWDNITPAMISGGFVGRCLFFDAPTKIPRWRQAPRIDFTWLQHKFSGVLKMYAAMSPTYVRMSGEANEVIGSEMNRWDRRSEGDPQWGSCWRRAGEQSIKLALIHHCMIDTKMPDEDISRDSMEWATRVVDISLSRMIAACRRSGSQEGELGKICAIVRESLRGLGGEDRWIKARDLSRKIQRPLRRFCKGKETVGEVRDRAIQELSEGGEIVMEKTNSAGRPSIQVRLT